MIRYLREGIPDNKKDTSRYLDAVIIGAFFKDQILEGNPAEEILDERIQLFPHRKRLAAHRSRTGIRRTGQTSHRRQRLLSYPQNIGDGVFCRRASKPVATALSVKTRDQSRL